MVRYAFLATSLLGFHFQHISAKPMPVDFLNKYCYDCHGEKKQKADRRFDFLTGSVQDFKQQELWQEILDQLNLGEMPPEDERQPSEREKLAVVDQITQGIADSREKFAGKGRHTVLRRLNKFEYSNTIGDLLGLNTESWNPAADFPADVTVDGFDNDGAELVTSGLLLEKYFPAAEEAIVRATNFGDKPGSKLYTQKSPFYFKGKESKGLPKLFQVDRYRFVPETPYTDLYGRYFRGGHLGFLPLRRTEGIPESGNYTIRVKASAVTRTHSYGKILDDFRNGDLWSWNLHRWIEGKARLESETHEIGSLDFVRADGQPQWFEWTGYLEKGYEVEVRFEWYGGRQAFGSTLLNKADEFPEFKPFAKMKDGGKGGLERWHGTPRPIADQGSGCGKFKWRVRTWKNGHLWDMIFSMVI